MNVNKFKRDMKARERKLTWSPKLEAAQEMISVAVAFILGLILMFALMSIFPD